MQTVSLFLIGFIIFFSAFFSIEKVYLNNKTKEFYSTIQYGHKVNSLYEAISKYGINNLYVKTISLTEKDKVENKPISFFLTNKGNKTLYSDDLEMKIKYGDLNKLFVITSDGDERIQII